MNIKFNREISVSPEEIKHILIKYLNSNHDISGVFDVQFIVINKPKQSTMYFQDTVNNWVFDGANIRVSENENP